MTRRYLLIDDNPEFAENVAEILRDTGAEVEVAGSGPAALARVGAARFDALVTDMRMPGMTGAELLHMVREVDPGVPVVLLSAYAQDEELDAARRDGLLAVLSKTSHQVPRLLEVLGHARRDGALVLVEDDVALAENLSEAFAARGLTVCTAAQLAEVDQLGVRPFAALVDLKVPGGAFGEAVERVRRRFPGTPLLVLTAFAAEAPSACEGLYRKPFDTAQLVAQVEALYQRHEGGR